MRLGFISGVAFTLVLGLGALPAVKAAEAGAMSSGEVRKIDKDAGKVTIKHGPLDNLDMPAMTMVFRVKDPAMLDSLEAGEQIRFTAEKANGALTVTAVEPAQ
jgi:Cu(I)/Ag(I) efflux system protein CusF